MPALLRVVTGVGLATVLYKLLAALQQVLIARVLGATQAADAYFLAQVLPVLGAGLLYNALSSSTLFVLRDVKRPALVTGLLLQVTACTVVLAGGVLATGGFVLRWIAPGSSGALIQQASRIQDLLLPVLLFQAVGGFLSGFMLSQGRVALPAISMSLFYSGGLAGLFLTRDGSPSALAIGLTVGALLQAVCLAVLSRRKTLVRPEFDRKSAVVLLRQTLPALGCNAISTLLLVSDRSFAAGFGDGQVAAVSYVYSLITMPTQIIVNTIIGVSMPGWVAASQDSPAFAEAVTKALAVLSVALVPITIAMALGAAPITAILLGTARFSEAQIASIADLLVAYSPAIAYFAAKDALTAAALARGRAGLAFRIGLLAVLVAISLKWLLAPALGIKAAPLATNVALAFASIALAHKLSSSGPDLVTRYWRHSREALLATIPSVGGGLAVLVATDSAWAAVVAAMALYTGCWMLLGGPANSLQILRGRW